MDIQPGKRLLRLSSRQWDVPGIIIPKLPVPCCRRDAVSSLAIKTLFSAGVFVLFNPYEPHRFVMKCGECW